MKKPLIQYVAYGSVLICLVLNALLLVSMLIYTNDYVFIRLLFGAVCLAYLALSVVLLRKKRHSLTAIMLVLFYYTIAAGAMLAWGINAPIALLCMAFVLLLAIIGLGSSYMIPVTVAICLTLSIIAALDVMGIVNPDESSLSKSATIGDALGYCAIFGIFAVLSFMASRRLETALMRSRQSEMKLRLQKRMINDRLESRTDQLSHTAIAEIRQASKFEELGQVSASTLHDLANALNVLSLDIDDLLADIGKVRGREIKSSLGDLRYLLTKFRSYLVENTSEDVFNPIEILRHLLSTDQYKKKLTAEVTLKILFNQERKIRLKGDSFRYKQVVSVVLGNALKAVETISKQKKVNIECLIESNMFIVSIDDNGPGIPNTTLKDLLRAPVRNPAGSGMGIGLFIANEIMTSHFRGSISIKSIPRKTQVKLTFPIHAK
jgi:signal transduction histidine kinase